MICGSSVIKSSGIDAIFSEKVLIFWGKLTRYLRRSKGEEELIGDILEDWLPGEEELGFNLLDFCSEINEFKLSNSRSQDGELLIFAAIILLSGFKIGAVSKEGESLYAIEGDSFDGISNGTSKKNSK